MAKKPFVIPAPDTIPVEAHPNVFFRAVRGLVVKPLLTHVLFNVKVQGREKLPKSGFVLIANHSSWVDGWLLLAAMPPKPRPHILGDPTAMIKLRVAGIPVGKAIWWGIRRVGGLICVDRSKSGDPVLRRQAVASLKIGGALDLFPEGRYLRFPGEDPDKLLPLKPGFAHFAHEADVPIVPVAVNGGRRLWLRKRIDIVVGDPVPTAGRDWRTPGLEAKEALQSLMRPDTATGRLRLFEKQLTITAPPSDRTRATLNGSHL